MYIIQHEFPDSRTWHIGVTLILKTLSSTQVHFGNRVTYIGLGRDKYTFSFYNLELIREGKQLDSL